MSDVCVVVIGAMGKMGRTIMEGLSKEKDIIIAGAIDVLGVGRDIADIIGGPPRGVIISADLEEVIGVNKGKPLVAIDFTHKDAVKKNLPLVLGKKVHAVVGTTGLTEKETEEFGALAQKNKVGLLIAPNFSLGAVLMMKMAREIARYYDQAEIIEYHNDKKIDSPSGTAIATAKGMAGIIARQTGNSQDAPSRGGTFNGIHVHSVRLKSLVAHQEVMFAGLGELLTIRHDSFSRESFLPGILMAVRKVRSWEGLKFGLDSILE